MFVLSALLVGAVFISKVVLIHLADSYQVVSSVSLKVSHLVTKPITSY